MYLRYKIPLIIILAIVFIWLSYLAIDAVRNRGKADEPRQTQQTVPEGVTLDEPDNPPAPIQPVVNPPAPVQPVVTDPLPNTPSTLQPLAPVNPPPQPATVNTPSVDCSAALAEATALLNKHEYLLAREKAQSILKTAGVTMYSDTWYKAAQIVDACNKVFMYSRQACPEKQTYTVKSGDVLVRIAHRLKTTVQALMKMNGITRPQSLYEGAKLTYLAGTWAIHVSKSHFTLVLTFNGDVYRIFKVGIGRENRTPVGVFRIKDRIMNPDWDSPEGRIKAGDERNILGTRWMGLEAIEGTNEYLTGYGIHGTTLPETVGTPSSAGCVRLKNEDVEDLFNFIPEPTADTVRVTITE